ncbi:hypothetical protein FPOAC2_14284 [Fusarium poae]
MGRVSGPELDSQVSCNRMAHFVRKGCWSVAAQTSGDVGVTPSIVDPRTKKELEKKTVIQRVSVQIQPLLHGTRLSVTATLFIYKSVVEKRIGRLAHPSLCVCLLQVELTPA